MGGKRGKTQVHRQSQSFSRAISLILSGSLIYSPTLLNFPTPALLWKFLPCFLSMFLSSLIVQLVAVHWLHFPAIKLHFCHFISSELPRMPRDAVHDVSNSRHVFILGSILLETALNDAWTELLTVCLTRTKAQRTLNEGKRKWRSSRKWKKRKTLLALFYKVARIRSDEFEGWF